MCAENIARCAGGAGYGNNSHETITFLGKAMMFAAHSLLSCGRCRKHAVQSGRSMLKRGADLYHLSSLFSV